MHKHELQERELARALRGCIAACVEQPLRKFRPSFLSGLFPPSKKALARLYEACENAFEQEAEEHFTKLKAWALLPTEHPRSLPFPREVCERFITTFFVSKFSETAHATIARRAEQVVKATPGMPPEALYELLRQEFRFAHSETSPIKKGFPKKARKRIMEEGAVLGTQWFALFTLACVHIALRSLGTTPVYHQNTSNVVSWRRATGGP